MKNLLRQHKKNKLNLNRKKCSELLLLLLLAIQYVSLYQITQKLYDFISPFADCFFSIQYLVSGASRTHY